MKKALLLLTVICGLTVAAHAQTKTVKKKRVTTTRTTAAAKATPAASTTTTTRTTTTAKASPAVATTTTTRTASTASPQGRFSIGLEAGLPLGDISNGYSFVIGGSLKYEYPVAPDVYVTGTAGYSNFIGKSDDFGKVPNAGFIPVKAGAKYFFAESFYGEAQLGVVFSTQSGGGTAFAYSPGIGYSFSPNVDLGVRYEAWSNNGTIGQFAARLAYSF